MVEEGNVWILDIVQEYLQSPQWKTPIVNFIEDNCLVFDDDDENKLEYTTVHKKFKDLVDSQLEEYMNEIGIPATEFVKACQLAVTNGQKKTVAQILAVEDFILFKKMMLNRNKAMNAEAMEAMKRQGMKVNKQLEQQVNEEAIDADLAAAIAESKAMMEAAEAAKKLEEQEQELLRKQSVQSESAFVDKTEEVKQPEPVAKVEEPVKQPEPVKQAEPVPEPVKPQEQQNSLPPVQAQSNSFPLLSNPNNSALPSLNGNQAQKQQLQLFDEINFDEADTEEVREVKEQKKQIQTEKKKIQEEGNKKRTEEFEVAKQNQNNEDEAAKAERIKKGLAAMGQAQNSEDDIAQKRKNIYHDIGAALKEGKQ